MKFVCVKAKPLYDARHVNRILAMLRLHSTKNVTLTCLTDDAHGLDPAIEVVELEHKELNGWWHKMQLFQWTQTQKETICYIDLDTIICGNIDPLTDYDGEFAVLRDFFLGEGNYQSSVMLLRGGFGKNWRIRSLQTRPKRCAITRPMSLLRRENGATNISSSVFSLAPIVCKIFIQACSCLSKPMLPNAAKCRMEHASSSITATRVRFITPVR